MKILRKKKCGFTIIEILVVLSIIAALIGIAGKSLMPRNPLVDDDVLKIRDFIEMCVFECRTRSLSHFGKCKDKSGKDVEFFTSGRIYASDSKPDGAKLYGKSSAGGAHVKYMVYKQRSNSGFDNKLCFEFPKLRKKITDIRGGIFLRKENRFSICGGINSERDINAGGLLVVKNGGFFDRKNWNTFFDGVFMVLDRPYFDDNEKFLCWEVTFDGREEWCFYVDNLCICHSVRRK